MKDFWTECLFIVRNIPDKTDEVVSIFLTILQILLCRNITFQAGLKKVEGRFTTSVKLTNLNIYFILTLVLVLNQSLSFFASFKASNVVS
jgi:hypothetical protein